MEIPFFEATNNEKRRPFQIKIKIYIFFCQIVNNKKVVSNYGPLTLFRPGGRRILPAATLDINNFLNIKANATKLGDFF